RAGTPAPQAPAAPTAPRTADDAAANQAANAAADAAAQRAEQAVERATRGLPVSVRDQVRDQIRGEIRNAVRNGTQPQIVIPNDFTNAVPRGAVEISTAFFVTIAAIIILTPLARALARRSDARVRALEDSARNLHPQLEQLQNSVDAMAIELERISEAQRFQSKLLAGKDAEPARVER
ncbi:MAG TPA: hypothetical protein VG916_06065, partial [Gemmatimonadaceae bacterium]|nr:hypothetical protein [Gemmatimonadaceae bacterium]